MSELVHMKRPEVFPVRRGEAPRGRKRPALVVEALCGDYVPFGEVTILSGDKQWENITCTACCSPESKDLYERITSLHLLKRTEL